MKIKNIIFGALVVLLVVACQGGKTASGEGGDTLQMKYAELLTIVKHNDGAYTEAIIENPWKKGTTLHKYILVPKGKEGDETVARLKDDIRENATLQMGSHCDIVRTPLESNVVFTAPHCQLMYELGCKNAITGVCDKDYINIPDIKERVKLSDGKASTSDTDKVIIDCGSSMQPDIERIIALKPEGLFISPFENSGGYGRVEKLNIPIIECADYMETSALGRAEWMRFYGLLFGEAQKADSLFAEVEKNYNELKALVAPLSSAPSVISELKNGSAWYVPGGKSTSARIYADAGANYVFADDEHSGSVPLAFETVFDKGQNADFWLIKYNQAIDKTYKELEQDYAPYTGFRAFKERNIYGCNTGKVDFYEDSPFHPDRLLKDLIKIFHPTLLEGYELKYFTKLAE